jgi:YesN/AraC family two-component response regulator
MKNIKLIIITILVSVSFTATAQTESKVIVLLTKANWCTICQANGGRTFANFGNNNKDNFFQIVANDITDSKSKTASIADLQKAGVVKISKNYLAAGVLTFIDKKTKKILNQITVANSDEELTTIMNNTRDIASK